MSTKKIDQLILATENYLECWKQFNRYLALARGKKFSAEDESQFLELKCVIAQELETLLAAFESGLPTREETTSLITRTPSIRFVSELNETSLREMEGQWHRIFIAWQSILGQLKVQQRQARSRSLWARLTGRG